MSRPPHVFSISSGAPFLRSLRDALFDGSLYDDWDIRTNPLTLSDLTIYLPTRRAVQFLKEILAEEHEALVLPDIRPLADASTRDIFEDVRSAASDDAAETALSSNARVLILSELVAQWHKSLVAAMAADENGTHRIIGGTSSEFFHLAQELASLLDTFTIHGVDAKALKAAFPADQDKFWELTHKFMSIVLREWPGILAEANLADPVRLHEVNIAELTARIENKSLQKRIIIAGSTGSMPSTARLIRAVAHAPLGRVILPGIDFHSADADFPKHGADDVHWGHPQFIMARLTALIGIQRSEIKRLGKPGERRARREWLAAHALMPAEATAAWHSEISEKSESIAMALAGCALIEARDEEEESKAIACAIRETLENPRATVALVTPDRSIVDRIKPVLDRWSIPFHDSADTPCARTSAGTLLITLAEWMAYPHHPETVCAMLAQPDTEFCLSRDEVTQIHAYLEMRSFRDAAPPATIDQFFSLLEGTEPGGHEQNFPLRGESVNFADGCKALATDMRHFAQKNAAVVRGDPLPIRQLIEAHLELATLATAQRHGSLPEDVAAITQDTLETLRGMDALSLTLTAADYARILPTLLGRRHQPLVPQSAGHVHIFGLLEARLMEADLIILAGLNEQGWPPQPDADAFITRGMRNTLGLPQLEQSIGQTAHDFVQSLTAADRVIISRSNKDKGTPTIASRFLQRIAAFAGPDNAAWSAMARRGRRYMQWAQQLDATEIAPASRPSPVISADMMPRRISVTDAEIILRDPYAFFARKILKLEEPGLWNRLPEAQLRGIIVHEAVARLAQAEALDPFALHRWEAEIDAILEIQRLPDALRLFWRPGLYRLGEFFTAWHGSRITGARRVTVEVKGALQLAVAPQLEILLSGRADRIEMHDDFAAIIDFKTGAVPTRKAAESGLSPQLLIEAAMAAEGAFGADHARKPVQALLYLGLKIATGEGKESAIFPDRPQDIPDISGQHLRAFRTRLERHALGELGFISRRFPMNERISGAYDHLARVAEWSRLPGLDGDE